jgi:hypothetical protein
MIFTNLVAGMVLLSPNNTISTNTSAFQEYAFHKMFVQASNLLTVWKEDIGNPITTNMVTYYRAVAYPSGLGGTMAFSNRFAFSWVYGGFMNFGDKPYNCQMFLTDNVQTNDAVLEKWMLATNHLTMKKAEQIAEAAMRSAGVPIDKMGFKKPTEQGQRKYEWKDGKTYPLPYYEFYWRTDNGSCDVDVSGITSNVVGFFFAGPYLRFQTPTNYFEMLGLTNKPVFVKRMFTPPGQPPAYRTYPP